MMMKRILFFSLLVFLCACSTDKEELDNNEFQELDLSHEIDDCEIYSIKFGTYGEIEVRNFHDFLEVTVTSNDASINQLNLHFSHEVDDFPTVGNNKLIPARMMYINKFDPDTYEVKLTYSFKDLSIDGFYENLFIAAFAEFGSGKEKTGVWAGEDKTSNAEWSYFEYEVTPFVYYAGSDKLREITRSEVAVLPSYDEVRKLFANMLDEGVNRNDGVYSPSIKQITTYYNSLDEEAKLDDFTLTYTLGEGECSDSAELTMRVTP